MFWSLGYPGVRGSSWRGQTCVKNLPSYIYIYIEREREIDWNRLFVPIYVPVSLFHTQTAVPISAKFCTDLLTNSKEGSKHKSDPTNPAKVRAKMWVNCMILKPSRNQFEDWEEMPNYLKDRLVSINGKNIYSYCE